MLIPLLFLALATQQFATATDPATLQQTSVDCRIAALAYDVDLGHASNHSGDTIDRVCITAQDDVYHLASDGRTLKALTGHGWNGNVHLSLQAVAPNLWSVLSCRAASTAVRTWEGRRKLLTASGRYFEGQRRVRLLSVLVEVQGAVAEYAGSSREEREAWAMEQRTFMSSVYEWSTYSKLGFDESASIVRTVVLLATQELTNSDCSNRGFEIARLAAAQLEAEGFDWQRVDGVLYYEPETATPSCGRNGWGTLGVCYVGLLDAPTFQPAPAYRQSHFWRAGCFVRYQRAGVAARANIGAHEVGRTRTRVHIFDCLVRPSPPMTPLLTSAWPPFSPCHSLGITSASGMPVATARRGSLAAAFRRTETAPPSWATIIRQSTRSPPLRASTLELYPRLLCTRASTRPSRCAPCPSAQA